MNHRPTALIAEDEPLLAQELQAELARIWPELHVVALVADGKTAVEQALQLKPDVLFFDIQMPGINGLEAASELLDAWHGNDFPALVFVTAYDQFAIQAFEAQAMDYLLKPVQAARLKKTVTQVQQRLASRSDASIETTLAQLQSLIKAAPHISPPLHVIQASTLQGNHICIIPIAEVMYFEAADKYIRVMTVRAGVQREYLIRTPLKELILQLDATIFWQIHRSTVVCSTAIESVSRDEAGKLYAHLRGYTLALPISRLYSHLFRAM
jgi:DNA-binding LytR/AlgR family response regulator